MDALNPYALNIKLKSRKIVKPKSLDAYKAPQKIEVIGHREKIYYRNHFKNEVRWIPATYIKPLSTHTHSIMVKGSARTVHRNQFRKLQKKDKYPMYQCVLNSSLSTDNRKSSTSKNEYVLIIHL